MNKKKVIILIIYLFIVFLILKFIPTVNNPLMPGINNIMKLFVGIILGFLPFIISNKMDGNLSLFKKNTVDQGSAKKGNINELKGLTVPVNSKKNAGFLLSKNVRLSLDKSFEHVAIIGPTGAGKSSSFFIPTILDCDGTYSIVIVDPKKEIHAKTSNYLKSLGMDIIQLMPLDSKNNKIHYNPLLIAETNTQIRELSQLILVNGSKAIEQQMGGSSGGGDQASWINMAVPLFTATLAYVRKFGTKKSIAEAIDIILDMGIDQKSLNKAEEMFQNDPIALKNFKIFKSSGGSEKTISSIKSVLGNNVQLFIDENIEEFTKTPFNISTATGQLVIDKNKMFDPKSLRKKPTALFVSVEEIKSDYTSPLMAVFYSQILDICMSNFDDVYKCPVLFLLDEFANIGVVPSIEKITATARSRKIGISIGIQGIEQLKNNYGENNANTILNNLKTKVFYPGLAMETAKYASDLSGYGTVESKNYSSGDSSGKNVIENLIKGDNISTSGVRRELYTSDEIRRLADGKLLIIAHNRNPVEDDQNIYYTQKKYLKKIKN